MALACNRDPHGMVRQLKARPYDGSPVFEDGRSLRTPPPGTVTRDSNAWPDPVATGLTEGRPLDEVPIPLTEEMLRRGRHDFQIWCAACHGLLGDGMSVPARKMALRAPPSLIAHAISPGDLYQAISVGYGLMAPYCEELSVPERWGVVAYVEALRRSQRAPLSAAPAAEQQALETSR